MAPDERPGRFAAGSARRDAAGDPVGAAWRYSATDWTNRSGGVRWARRVLGRDPERPARVLRRVTAGYLAQCDRPRAPRPKLLFAGSMISDHGAWTPQTVRSIAPDA